MSKLKFGNYSFHQKLLVRVPRFSQESISRINRNDPSFQEMIYIASPSLWEKMLQQETKDQKDAGLENTIQKYKIRSSCRATPFGLFAGCGLVEWAKETDLRIGENTISRKTRMDMHVLVTLALQFSEIPEIRECIRFYPNRSIYPVGDKLRYTEYSYQQGRRYHTISQVDNFDILETILKANDGNGATLKEYASLIQETNDFDDDTCYGFLVDLLRSQLLVSELEPAITGEDLLRQLIDKISKVSSERVRQLVANLEVIADKIEELDKQEVNEIEDYQSINFLIEKLFTEKTTINNFLQVDMYRDFKKKSLSGSYRKKLMEVVELLSFHKPPRSPHLQNFKASFSQRYGEAFVPLPEVMDSEHGLGYGMNNQSLSSYPLVDDVVVSKLRDEGSTIRLSEWHLYLKKQIESHSKEKKGFVINLDKETIVNEFHKDDEMTFPDSFHIMFSLVKEGEHELINLINSGGTSAANMLARFSGLSNDLKDFVGSVIQKEDQINEGVIMAEIVHLPEKRTGNILLRPAFRKYEIPYLANSSALPENQIHLNDLLVSVAGGEVILKSKSRQKVVVPRLTNAHNFHDQSLPVYHFLCDLQSPDSAVPGMFDWGDLRKLYTFLPRVTYKDVIVSLAQWSFGKDEIKTICGTDFKSFAKIKEAWNLPAVISVKEGDNLLKIDLSDPEDFLLFQSVLQNRSTLLLEEYLSPSAVIQNEEGKYYAHEFIATVVRNELPVKRLHGNDKDFCEVQDRTQRDFYPGSEWLYYKLYCGEKTADMILEKFRDDFVDKPGNKDLISKWFFIRYADPVHHLRIRFLVPDKNDSAGLQNNFNQFLHQITAIGLCWKVQIDTYSRELERYGYDHIQISEAFFHHDSKRVLQTIGLVKKEDENFRWQVALYLVDSFLSLYQLDYDEKARFYKTLKDQFYEEFNIQRKAKKKLDTKYRVFQKEIAGVLEQEDDRLKEVMKISGVYLDAMRILAEGELKKDQTVGLKVPLYSLIGSYIHMTLNRYFSGEQRLHECIIYDFLFRFYRSKQAMMSKN